MPIQILVRHCESRANTGETGHYDPGLSLRGEGQLPGLAHRVRSYLGADPFQGFVSPFRRCLETAQSIRSLLPFVVDPGVGEYPGDGFLNQEFDDLMVSRGADFPWANWAKFPTEGIDWKRHGLGLYWSGLERFVSELPERALVVSHLTTIQDLGKLLTGSDWRGQQIRNASVTLIRDGVPAFIGSLT